MQRRHNIDFANVRQVIKSVRFEHNIHVQMAWCKRMDCWQQAIQDKHAVKECRLIEYTM